MVRQILIDPALNGWIISIGCQRVVFTSLETMTKEIGRYYASPKEVEAEYKKNAVNDVITGAEPRMEENLAEYAEAVNLGSREAERPVRVWRDAS